MTTELKKQRSPLAAHLRKTIAELQDEVYGAGFRLAHTEFTKQGMPALMEYMRTNKQLPSQ